MSDPVQRLSEFDPVSAGGASGLVHSRTLAILAQSVLASVAIVWPLSPVGWGILVIIALTHVVFLVMLTNFACGPVRSRGCRQRHRCRGILLLAERWQADPVDGVDLMVLLTGCEETGMLGAAAWASANRRLRNCCRFLTWTALASGAALPSAEVPIVGLPRGHDRRMLASRKLSPAEWEKPPIGIAFPGQRTDWHSYRRLPWPHCCRLPAERPFTFWHQPGHAGSCRFRATPKTGWSSPGLCCGPMARTCGREMWARKGVGIACHFMNAVPGKIGLHEDEGNYAAFERTGGAAGFAATATVLTATPAWTASTADRLASQAACGGSAGPRSQTPDGRVGNKPHDRSSCALCPLAWLLTLFRAPPFSSSRVRLSKLSTFRQPGGGTCTLQSTHDPLDSSRSTVDWLFEISLQR